MYLRESINTISKKYPKGHRFVCVEVGVHDGNHADTIIGNLKLDKLTLVDGWEAYEGMGYDHTIMDQTYWDGIHKLVQNKYKGRTDVEIMRLNSDAASLVISDESQDFVYIDACHHYEAVKKDLNNWWPKVKTGGYLAGHDWTYPTVVQAVIEFCTENGLEYNVVKNETEWWISK